MTNLQGRLKKLEAWLTPTSDNEGVLTIVVTSIGEPDKIIELRGLKPIGRRRPWPPYRNDGPER